MNAKNCRIRQCILYREFTVGKTQTDLVRQTPSVGKMEAFPSVFFISFFIFAPKLNIMNYSEVIII